MRALATRVLALALGAGTLVLAPDCGQSSIPPVPIASWCTEMETALRDRLAGCGCEGEPLTDDEIAARCAALPATSLLAAYDGEELGWNGSIAAAHVRRLEGCEPLPVVSLGGDDPVLGEVAPGEPCRVFSDAWGAPDDCEHGARCLAPLGGGEPRCIAVVAEGEACDEVHACEPGLECAGGTCACAGATCEPTTAVCPAIASL